MKSLTFLTALLALPLAAAAQTAPSCSAATLNGVRALILTGRDVSSAAVLSKAFQSTGTATFDGVGKVSFNLTANTNVAAGASVTWSGSYTLGSNCVGVVNVLSGDLASFTLIAYNQGKAFSIVGQDGTYALTGTGSTAPAACANATLSGVWVFNGTGFSLTGNAVTGVTGISGTLQFNGRGSVGGSWSVVTNGSSTPATVSGQYSVTSACLASAAVTDASGVAYALNLAFTSADGSDAAFDIATPLALFALSGHATFTNPGLAVVSAASGSAASTPAGSIFALYGSGLATSSAQPNNVPLPTTELTTSCTVNGEAVPLFYVSPTQINAQMPLDVVPGLATVVVTNGSTTSNSVAIGVPATATPEIFLYGNNRAVVQNADFSLNSPTSPTHVGDVVVAYFTGGGPVTASGPWLSGHASPNGLSPVTEPAVIAVGSVTAKVAYVGLTPTLVGLYQANFTVPQVAAGDRNLVISIGGTASAAALISVAN
jgi:uncharacterized protein (TIGR03437 family)